MVKAVEAEGRRGFAFKGNVAREAEILAMFAAVDKALGPIWGLVNNAGITGKIGRVEDVTAATVQDVIDVNVVGALLCAREAIKRMSTKRGGAGGVIVNLSSVAVSIGSPNTYVWYAAAKGAVDSMTLGLGLEVAREGIRVVGVAPGPHPKPKFTRRAARDRAQTGPDDAARARTARRKKSRRRSCGCCLMRPVMSRPPPSAWAAGDEAPEDGAGKVVLITGASPASVPPPR